MSHCEGRANREERAEKPPAARILSDKGAGILVAVRLVQDDADPSSLLRRPRRDFSYGRLGRCLRAQLVE